LPSLAQAASTLASSLAPGLPAIHAGSTKALASRPLALMPRAVADHQALLLVEGRLSLGLLCRPVDSRFSPACSTRPSSVPKQMGISLCHHEALHGFFETRPFVLNEA